MAAAAWRCDAATGEAQATGLNDVEYETLSYVEWFNHRRLHGEVGMVPPAEV